MLTSKKRPMNANFLPKFSQVLRAYRDPTYYRGIPKQAKDAQNPHQATPFDTLEQEAPGAGGPPIQEAPAGGTPGGLSSQGLNQAVSDVQTQRELDSPVPLGPTDVGSARKQMKKKGKLINDLGGSR